MFQQGNPSVTYNLWSGERLLYHSGPSLHPADYCRAACCQRNMAWLTDEEQKKNFAERMNQEIKLHSELITDSYQNDNIQSNRKTFTNSALKPQQKNNLIIYAWISTKHDLCTSLSVYHESYVGYVDEMIIYAQPLIMINWIIFHNQFDVKA